jgi:hypothetical protein
MKRLFFVCLSAAVVVGGAVRDCVAQGSTGPTILQHYRVVPRHSTLRQTGGFAGVDWRYRVMGHYDFQHTIGWDGWSSSASFENAELWGSLISDGPVIAVVIDVDQVLNLEGLQGKQLQVAAPFDVYQFRGKTSDGSSVELFASLIGPWMYLRGGTQPPPESADYFVYQLQALARTGPFADFNSDGVVDTLDYVLLRKPGFSGGTDVAAGAGFAEWRQQYGESVPDVSAMDAMLSGALAGYVSQSAVPEPASLSLAIGAGCLLARARRRRA